MVTSDILIQQVADGSSKSWGFTTSLALTTAHSLFFAYSMGTAVVRILVLHYWPHTIWQVTDWARNLDRKQVLIPPCTDSRLSIKNLEQSLVACYVGGYCDAPLFSDFLENLFERLARQIRRGFGTADPELAEEPFKLFLNSVWRVNAKYVDAFGGRKLETGENRDLAIRSGISEFRNATDTVVISDGKHRHFKLRSLLNDGLRVI